MIEYDTTHHPRANLESSVWPGSGGGRRLIAAVWLVVALVIALAAGPASATIVADDPGHMLKAVPPKSINEVVVFKSERLLLLYHDGLVVDTYKISLGLDPTGAKHRRGDDRTPVGQYTLDWRNPNSRFHRSLHISYPNARDRARARARGVSAGDNIMIHGQPDYSSRTRFGDWTHGCIAVSNAAINQIWRLVADGTPISIYP